MLHMPLEKDTHIQRSLYDKLTKDEINSLPIFRYGGKVVVVHSSEDCEKALDILGQQQVIGVDTETRPSFRKGKVYPPSLIQIAMEGCVYLFPLKRVPFGKEIAALFEMDSVVKAGVAIHDDFRFLGKLHPFSAQSVCDLAEVAKTNNMSCFGLRALAAQFLRVRISKGEQCSNWGNAVLTPRQIRYAATDAWISREIYYAMKSFGFVDL